MNQMRFRAVTKDDLVRPSVQGWSDVLKYIKKDRIAFQTNHGPMIIQASISKPDTDPEKILEWVDVHP